MIQRTARIEKCSSPTGDGKENKKSIKLGLIIEKCSSPTGDGKLKNKDIEDGKRLRNVVPRQGTETKIAVIGSWQTGN